MCGGPSAVSIYVASKLLSKVMSHASTSSIFHSLACPDDQVRFGDHCYKALFGDLSSESCVEDDKSYHGSTEVTWHWEYSIAACQKRCLDDSSCEYWTWHKTDPEKDKCYLFSDQGTVADDTTRISGPKSCAGENITDNADGCFDKGGLLWYPETAEELQFVKHAFPVPDGYLYHLGYKNYSREWGVYHLGGDFIPGIPFYTRKSFTKLKMYLNLCLISLFSL